MTRPPDALAYALTYAVNPLVLPVLGLALIADALGAGWKETAWVGLVAFGLLGAVPLAYLVRMVRRGEARSLEVRQRSKRTRPLLVGMGCTVAALGLLAFTLPPGRTLVVWIVGLQTLNTLLILAINLRWKISVHLAALAGTLGLLAFTAWQTATVDTAWMLALAGLLPLLAWARVRVRAHTPAQVAGGTLFGLVVPPGELLLLHHLGLV